MSDAQEPATKGEVATFSRLRIPYHPLVKERFDIDQAGWRALIDAIWPAAKTADAVVLALSYCKARNLDPFKRPIHIVPIWSKELGRMTESVWPGIGELRTTAFRTGLYAGRDKPEYGPCIESILGAINMAYPEWCEITVYRLGKNGERMPYPGPRVYWIETYATAKRDSEAPNDMWRRRPYGQIEKCAEAAALRAAFPEELGNEYAAEEMEGQVIDPHGNVERAAVPLIDRKQSNLERFEDRHGGVTDVDVDAAADPAPFEVIDMTGTVAEYADAEAAVDAYRAALAEAEKQNGEAGLAVVWDNNQGFMNHLDQTGHDALSKELSTEYGAARQAAANRAMAAREAEAAKAKPAEPKPAAQATAAGKPEPQPWPGPVTGGESGSVGKQAPAAAKRAPPPRQAAAAPTPDEMAGRFPPQDAPTNTDRGNDAPGLPSAGGNLGGSAPAGGSDIAGQERLGLGVPADGEASPDARPSLAIAPVLHQGKPEWRTWVIGLLMPKLRQATDSNALADLLGDNEENLTAARRALSKEDLAELNRAITAQWDKVGTTGNGEAQ